MCVFALWALFLWAGSVYFLLPQIAVLILRGDALAPGTLLPDPGSFTVTLTRYVLLFLAQGSPLPYYLLLLKFFHLVQGTTLWSEEAAALSCCPPSGRPPFILGLNVFEVPFLILIPCGPLTLS